MIATPVGGIEEDLLKTKTGLLSKEITPESIAEAIKRFFAENHAEECKKNIEILKKDLSWKNFCSKLISFANEL